MNWTDERVEQLKKLWADGLSASQIAAELGGITRNAVIGKVHRLGLSGRGAPSAPGRTARISPPRPARPRRAVVRPSRVMAPPRPPVAASVTVPEGPGLVTDMARLAVHACKWPIGDPKSPEFSFCGRRASEGVYCVEHARVAYQPQVKRGKDGSSDLARSLRRYI